MHAFSKILRFPEIDNKINQINRGIPLSPYGIIEWGISAKEIEKIINYHNITTDSITLWNQNLKYITFFIGSPYSPPGGRAGAPENGLVAVEYEFNKDADPKELWESVSHSAEEFAQQSDNSTVQFLYGIHQWRETVEKLVIRIERRTKKQIREKQSNYIKEDYYRGAYETLKTYERVSIKNNEH